MVVDEVSEPLVDFVVAHWDVHADPRLQVNDVLLEAVDLHLRVLELLEELEADFVAFVYFFFHVEHVLGALVELDRHGQPLRFTYFVVFVDCLQLSLKLITFLGQELVLLVKQVIVFFEQFNFLLRRKAPLLGLAQSLLKARHLTLEGLQRTQLMVEGLASRLEAL